MLKIAIISDTLINENNPIGHYAFQLACSLARQQNDVCLISSEDQQIADIGQLPDRLEIFYPFKSWGLHELPMAAFFLNQVRPDVIHIFQASRKKSFFSGYPFLCDLLDFQYRPLKVFSLFNMNSNNSRHLCLKSDLITVQSTHLREKLYLQLKGLRKAVEYVPLHRSLPLQSLDNYQPFPRQIKSDNLLLIPCSVGDLMEPDKTLKIIDQCLESDASLEFAFTGNWQDYSPYKRNFFWQHLQKNHRAGRFHLIGSDEIRHWTFSTKNVFFWLSPINPLKCDLAHLIHLAAQMQAIPIFDSDGFSLTAADWTALQRLLHCENDADQLIETVHRHTTTPEERKELLDHLCSVKEKALVDHPSNVMNRLYFEMLSL